MVNKAKKSHQRKGSAALITTIAISTILVVLFVGISSIATREIRQSINSDNANRALYGAEAGVEDAVRRLTEDPTVREQECNDLNGKKEVEVSSSSENRPDVAWTCRTITALDDELTGYLDKDESLTLNLARGRTSASGGSYIHPASMIIEWNDPKNNPNPLVSKVSSWLPKYTPPGTAWTGAAAVEMTATWFQTNGNPDSGGNTTLQPASINKPDLASVMPVRTVIASPACTGANCSYSDFSPWNSSTYPDPNKINVGSVTPGSLVSNVTTKCDTASSREYSCGMPNLAGGRYDLRGLANTEISARVIAPTTNVLYNEGAIDGGFTNTKMLLRIRPRYSSMGYRIRFFAASGAPVFMPDGKATIDVTARSGDYFRRVVAKKQLVPATYDGVFDNALFSGGDICKNMRIYRDYRGAVDYLNWNGTTKEKNPSAGRNKCGNDSNV